MEILSNCIQTTLESFDFGFCIAVNVLTYIIIKLVDEHNGDKPVATWGKRLILFIAICLVSLVYYFANADLKLIINSSILAPVFWSWVMKPLCKKFNVDYKQVND